MSIITDALNRLQSARARIVRPTAAHDSKQVKATTPESQEDEKKSTIDTSFVSVSIGGFLLAVVVAVGAYWWGGYPVSDIPKMTSSASLRGDPSLDLSIDETLDFVPLDQGMPSSDGDLVELLPGELPPLSPSSDDQENLEISEIVDDEDHDFTVSLSPQAMAEPVLDHESRLQEVASLSIDHNPVIASGSEEQAFNDDPTSVSPETLNGAQTESHAKVISSSRRSDVSPQSLVSPSENSEAIPQSLNSSAQPTRSLGQSRVEKNMPQVPSVGARSSLSLVKTDSPRVSDSEISHEPIRAEIVMRSTEDTATQLSPEQRLFKARLLIEQESYAEAIAVLEPLFAKPPSTWEPWFWMGTAHFGLGELEKAEDAFMEGLVRDETVPYLWVQRAVIEQQRGQYGKAMDALRQAELLDAKLPEVQLNLAYNLEHQGQVNLARRHYRQYLALTEGKSTYHAVRRKVLERILRM